tara:strand:+ start:7601 stop:8869 length:1269 start_codon:yes stop_codon:yes gene_type:complete
MAKPNLSPKSTTPENVLTATGSTDDVAASVPFGIYTGSADFISGAAAQVAYVYKKLGGDVIDIEITTANVYSAYEEAVLEYSYIVNLHQSKNLLANSLGDATGTFDHKGELKSGPESVNLKYPKFELGYARRMAEGFASEATIGGNIREYSASFATSEDQQDYDLQDIIDSASNSGVDDKGDSVPYSGKVGGKKVLITRVFYKSPRAMWRFYGYYGGVGVVGNYSTYGQFADDATFEIIPTWQNKMQAIMYEDSIYTRTSHYSYELINNRLRLHPTPSDYGNDNRIWVKFMIPTDAWVDDDDYNSGIVGVNNLNTLPFDNLPFENINSIGKQWIRKYALAVSKEMLGQVRGKFATLPIPGESVTLNGPELVNQAKEEQQQLRDKLMEILDQLTYTELTKTQNEASEAAANVLKNSPLPIFVG